MSERGSIYLSGEKRRGKTLGKTGRRIRLAILAVFAVSMVAWSSNRASESMRVRQAQVDISRIVHAARLFRADFGRCPLGIDELVLPPEGRAYLRRSEDPWGRPYRVVCPARLDPGGVDVSTGGPDGDLTGKDNISSL